MMPTEILRRAREATGLAEPTHAGRATSGRDASSSTRSAPRVPFALLVTGLIVGALALLLALNTASAANELERHDLNKRNADVAARVQDLRIQVAASGAPANLAAAAAALGMVPAGNPAFVVIGADGKARVMGDPQAATEAPVAVPTTPKPTPKATRTTSRSTTSPAPATSGSAAKKSGASKSKSKSKSKSASASKSTSTSTSPRPTSTPTPVVTLPGGTR